MLYHKIDTIFKRDPATKHKGLIWGDYSNPAFEFLKNNSWTFTEKVDGTNIRVILGPTDKAGFSEEARVTIGPSVTFGGRTEEAQLPKKLVATLQGRFLTLERRRQLAEMFPQGAVLFGEGYGAGIQAVGKHYRPDQDFILFDVAARDGANTEKWWWLERKAVELIAAQLGIPVVPIVGHGTLADMVELVRAGYASSLLDGRCPPEGLVARPSVELADRAGRRIITKLKARDFVN